MRSRMIDLALLVGLVVVSGGILWTLFTLGREPRVASTPTRPAAAAPATPGAAPGAGASAPARAPAPAAWSPSTRTRRTARTPRRRPTPRTRTARRRCGAAPPAARPAAGLAAPAATPPRVLPSGTLELERIGYSFVTGGPGACGVVLEAWTHVAVSRDLLEAYGCGATVTVTLDDPVDGRTEVLGVIGDTMNPSFSRTVNVYVGEDEPAFEYGTTAGTFTPR